MANTKNLKNNPKLRKAIKRCLRRNLKAAEVTLTVEQRSKLRRARKEKKIGLRAFLATEAKAAAKAAADKAAKDL